MMKDKNHYDMLQITRNASPEVIRAAYKSLSQKYHPDKNLNNPEATDIMMSINQAYSTLSNLERRKEYDCWLKEQEKCIQEDNTESVVQPSETEKIGAWLGIGIFLMPYIFAWSTLDKKYTDTARFVSFGWFSFVALMLYLDNEHASGLFYVWLFFALIFFIPPYRNEKKNDNNENTEHNTTSSVAQSSETVGALFVVGIFLMPFLFTWFTLNKKYSDATRFVSFGWFTSFIFVFFKESSILFYVWLFFAFMFFVFQYGSEQNNDVSENAEQNNEQKTDTDIVDSKTNK